MDVRHGELQERGGAWLSNESLVGWWGLLEHGLIWLQLQRLRLRLLLELELELAVSL